MDSTNIILPDELINIVMQYQGISWIDDNSKRKLEIMIRNAIDDLDKKSGVKNNYVESGRAQSLLLTRVMYERSNALDDFYKNYKNEIVAFINAEKVRKYVNKQKEITE